MLRLCAQQTCKHTGASSSALFHTSAAIYAASPARLRSRALKRKQSIEEKARRERYLEETRPSPILGTRPNDLDKWQQCKLAQTLVDESWLTQPFDPERVLSAQAARFGALADADAPESAGVVKTNGDAKSASETKSPVGKKESQTDKQENGQDKEKQAPFVLYRAFGIGPAEEKLLFRDLPKFIDASKEVEMRATPPSTATATAGGTEVPTAVLESPYKLEKALEVAAKKQAIITANFERLTDLRNSDAAGIAYENRRRIILAFSTPQNPFDPGRTEVQIAILTYRIRKLFDHLARCKHDVQNKLSLRKVVHQRAKLLRYLKRTQRIRYDELLEQIGLEPESAEGELAVE